MWRRPKEIVVKMLKASAKEIYRLLVALKVNISAEKQPEAVAKGRHRKCHGFPNIYIEERRNPSSSTLCKCQKSSIGEREPALKYLVLTSIIGKVYY